MVISVYGGYRTTLFLFSKYARPFSTSADELKDYKDLWLSLSVLCDLLMEYHRRFMEQRNTFAEENRSWIVRNAQPTLLQIKEKILEKQKQNRMRNERIDLLLRKFLYVCERINTVFQFPGDETLKNTVYIDFFQYLRLMNEEIEQKKLQRLIPVHRSIMRFQKVL